MRVRCALSGLMEVLINCMYSPMRVLRTFPPLQARDVIGITVTLVRDLPTDLYDELVRHPYEVSHR